MARNKYDVDEVVEQKFDIKQLKRLVDYIRPYKGKMFFCTRAYAFIIRTWNVSYKVSAD
jgi:hypothetical protein